ncbi:MAG: hypothetical protein JW997_06345 [Actinobacteria bacterium]|nr:hypothetical protein [Actinomycetota bacterium]
MRLAAIDIGTNSTRLLISEILHTGQKSKVGKEFEKTSSNHLKENVIRHLVRDMHITRLGGNLDKSGKISKKNAINTITVLGKYLEMIDLYKVEKFRAIGTRALRHAKNSLWFKNLAFHKTGIEIDIVSPEEEAALSFEGALGLIKQPSGSFDLNAGKKYADNLLNGNTLVIDIGGGSTEFISGNINDGISYIKSIEIGSVNISERFDVSDVCRQSDIIKMKEFIKINIKGAINDIMSNPVRQVYGVAGTVSALASVDMGLEKYNMDALNGYVLLLDNILAIQNRFCSLCLEERKKIKGLEPQRADIIIGGTEILVSVMECLGRDKLIVSENDILDGIIYSIF